MHIGLDFGTTNTSAATIEGGRLRLIPLDPIANRPVLRSVLFIGRDGRQLFGSEALEYYLRSNVGRIINYERRFLGFHDMVFADYAGQDDIQVVAHLHAIVDANAPGRLFQSLKMSLADDNTAATNVFGTQWTIEELIAAQLREIKRRIEEYTGSTISNMTIGRPVHYGVSAEADALAMERMLTACDLAELPPVVFLAEPVAAAYAYTATLDRACRALVFDFGGGTLDISVMVLDPNGNHEVLATDGVVIGGDRLDSKIVMGALLSHFGAGATLGANQRPLPAFLLDQLASWQQIMDLNTPRTIQIIEEAINTGDRPDQLRALRALVTTNSGVPLYAAVERAKVRLSSAEETMLQLDLDDIRLQHQLTRGEFEGLIGAEIRQIGLCLDRAISASGLTSDQIDIVIQTGGSSRIPRIVRLLAERFGPERLREQDPFTSIAAGLALAARCS